MRDPLLARGGCARDPLLASGVELDSNLMETHPAAFLTKEGAHSIRLHVVITPLCHFFDQFWFIQGKGLQC